MAPVPQLAELIDTVADRQPSTDPLDRLATAIETAREVERLGDELVTHFVHAARATGASWTDVGQVLGVTRQGAQQRHGTADRPELFWRPDGDRLTPRLRAALDAAGAEALSLGAGTIGTEHLLLGVLDVPGNLGLQVLEAAGASRDALAQTARATATAEADRHDAPEGLPYAPAARRALDRTLRHALDLGHNYVGCEHLVLALADDDSPAAAMLADAGVAVDRLHDELRQALSGPSA